MTKLRIPPTLREQAGGQREVAAEFNEVQIRKDPNCPVCGEHPTITEYVDYVEFCNPVRA